MEIQAFEDAVAALGWRYADFARRMEIEPSTIYRWRTGRTPIPRWVPEYLAMTLEIQRLHARFVAPIDAPKDAPSPE
jgi:transcriptional regulator with XRE-family HTH domain